MASPRSRTRKTTCMLPRRPTTPDRRGSDRSSCWLTCSCNPISLEQNLPHWPGRIRDVSPGGVALVLARSFRPGTFITIHLHAPSRREFRPLRARVVHATIGKNDTHWVVGCTLSRSLSQDEIDAVVTEGRQSA